jgi:WD40 repeat protein
MGDLERGDPIRTLNHFDVKSVAFDGTTIVSGSSAYTIKVWDVHTGEC